LVDYELFVGKEETDKGTYVGYVLVFRSALKDKKTYKISVTGIGSLEDIKVCAFDIMNHFNVLPSETIMVGDSKSDMLAGINAKCDTIAVDYSIKGEFYKDLDVNHVISELYEIIDIVKEK
jgi:ribonucleotide monophosphatase NagD (HAD superfamily)